MRKIKEVLRLASFPHMSERKIVLGANVPKTTVRDYLSRAHLAGLTWSEAESMDEATIEHLLFPAGDEPRTKKPMPDWQYVHQELRRSHVTMQLLWEEYRSTQPDGYSYSQYCELYRVFVHTLDLSMRQTHAPGEKVFVDYSGTRIPVIDPHTGEECLAEVFVAVLGASNFAYAEATWTQRLPDWIGAHTRAMHFFGGVAAAIVSDNLKSGVKDFRCDRLNSRAFRKMEGTSATQFATIDRPALRPLPAQPYEYAEWKKVRVNIDYHIEFDGHY